MEYRNLGKSGLQVSVMGLGGNNFGARLDQAETAAVVNTAIEMGVTFFDTADVYGNSKSPAHRGTAEECLGAALKPHRRDVVIASKATSPMGDGPYWRGSSRKYLMESVEASLRRLQTDYIDLYQMHAPDPRTPIEETLRALDDLVRSGKVRYLGCSNFAAWQVVEAYWTAKSEHLTRFISGQNHYNLLRRSPEDEFVPVCQRYGLGLIPFFPIAGGVLTGKYRPGEAPPAGSRLDGSDSRPNTLSFLNERNFGMLAKLDAFAQARGLELIDVAIGWLASLPYVGSIICGATRPEQVEQNARASDVRFNAEEMAELASITDDGQPISPTWSRASGR